MFRFPAEYAANPEFSEYWRLNVIRPGRGSPIGRAVIERRTVHIVDVLADPEFELHAAQRAGGYRSVLAVPMLRQDELVGVFFMWRTEVRAFTDQQIELVATFADQAVIAIENARLLSELQARNADLTEALEQQTATSEILRVISGSPTDLQPVLDAVAENAARLCGAADANIFQVEDEFLVLVTTRGQIPSPPTGSAPSTASRCPAARSSIGGPSTSTTSPPNRTREYPDLQGRASGTPVTTRRWPPRSCARGWPSARS